MSDERDINGRFQRQRAHPWTPDRWDDGYEDADGRFRVYRPDYPRAYAEGYALRAHVVWWIEVGTVHPDGLDLHHKNEIKLDDRFDNLELMTHGEHSRRHKVSLSPFDCCGCGSIFFKNAADVAKRRAEGNEPKYCSLPCYHRAARSAATRQKTSQSLRLAYAEGRR